MSDLIAKPFSDRLASLVEGRESQLVLGLDPDPAALWPQAVEAAGIGSDQTDVEDPAQLAGLAVAAHCCAAIDAAGQHCVAIKPQVACFERLGAAGWRALTATVGHAQDAGLLVIADAKRGDVPVTASAYAQAMIGSTPSPWGDIPGLGADAVTVNPLLGADSLEPFARAADQVGAGLFVLCRTSNPGAADLQDLPLASDGPGQTVSQKVAEMIDQLAASSVGESGLSSVGAVVGATVPEHLVQLRDAMPSSVLLLPGVGAQGGEIDALAAAFKHHTAGALVTVSRSLVNAYGETGGDPALACAQKAQQLRDAIWSVASRR
ncbi:MAG: orotidine-5'-phosphate decarboxylase [Thermoleophilaceae bacterium]|nr:orotidine-5'-phosphate decarboxylase [Thermoleophilaceae bacterium]